MNGRVVPLEVGLLLESLLADAADILWRFAAFVAEMTLQAAFVSVRLTALEARKRLRQEIWDPWQRITASRAITCNLEVERLRLFDLITVKGEKKKESGRARSLYLKSIFDDAG